MEGSNGKESPKCASCMNNIGQDDYVAALAQDWHKDCFRCSVCDALLSSWYFEKNGLLFCQPDYWARFGESCQQCSQVITGPVMAAGAHRFHPECFACSACGAPIEDAEPYALVERTRLYCGGCYSSSCDAHSIRVVALASSALRAAPCPRDPAALTVTEQCGGKFSCAVRALLRAALTLCIQLTCHRFDSSCGVVTLHIGDRILEINGAPPRACALDVRPPTLLQLTIEHNPEKTNKDIIMCNILPDTDQVDRRPQAFSNNNDYDTENKTKGHVAELKDTEMKKTEEERSSIEGKRERLFKRKGDDGGRTRVMKRRQTPSSPLLGDKERSSSMSKLLDVSEDTEEPTDVLCDLSRARSFRAEPDPGQKVFRACDLIQGELLGSGFFGEVYKVTHRDTNEVMVLKQLYRVDDDAQRNFLKEVAVLRSLSHPNVLRFVGVVYKDKRLHLVTEYVAGGTLHQLIQDTSISLSWRSRARLARDVSAGVGYLHRKNVIHRDLNSHNCLVREDKTVIVADFGLARLVQRTESSTIQRASHHNATLRRKRYTVVGNPYWMAPEMINGKVYDEKVDVFSFGVILCEIIGRVSADPDFLPRRSDFGLNEALFIEKFCRHTACPEPFYRVAFRACQLDPDARPPFEVIEIWLESLVMHLSKPGPLPPTLLADILQYAHGPHCGPGTPDSSQAGCQHTGSTNCQHWNSIQERIPCERDKNKTCCQEDNCCHCENTYRQREQCCVHAYNERCSVCVGQVGCQQAGSQQCSGGNCGCRVRRMPSNAGSEDLMPDTGVMKSKSNATIDFTICRSESTRGRALGKCVSASHICQRAPPRLPHSAAPLSRSQNTLASPGYILRAVGKSINITKVDDITEWLDSPRQLKRTNPDSQLNKREDATDTDLPAFLRNQSVEGLETQDKHDATTALPFCRHISIPDNDDSDSSDDEYIDCNWYKNVTNSKKMDVDPKNVISNFINKKSSYDVADVMLRNPECLNERKIPEEDRRRYNIDYLTKSPMMAEAIKHIPKTIEKDKEKTNFFTKTLTPKFGRLFKHSEVDKNEDKEKSKSKFFIQKPVSPNVSRSSYRVRPVDEERKQTEKMENEVLKSDIKLASLGKPMTPTFRRHVPNERPDFADGRFSYRVTRPKFDPKEPKFIDIGRSKIKAAVPIEKKIRSSQNNQIMSQNVPPVPQNRSLNLPLISNNQNKLSQNVKIPEERKRREGISRSNYVSLANLKINSKKDLDKSLEGHSPVERVI